MKTGRRVQVSCSKRKQNKKNGIKIKPSKKNRRDKEKKKRKPAGDENGGCELLTRVHTHEHNVQNKTGRGGTVNELINNITHMHKREKGWRGKKKRS